VQSFEDFNLSGQLKNAIDELGFEAPTPIQSESFSVVLSGRDIVGIAQTGTGKTLAYSLPILHQYKYSKEAHPRVLILVPTRELVLQIVKNLEDYTRYMSTRVLGVYGGTNINTQKLAVAEGMDILVATPGRLYDLVISRALQIKAVKKLIIDEVDVMLDLGFRPQLTNIFDLLPTKRQNIMYSATMTGEIDQLIDSFFTAPVRIAIAVSGTPLDNIAQSCYSVPNFYTKVNLLTHLLLGKKEFSKVLVFVSNKKTADRLFESLEELYGSETCVIHSNKSQNYRIRSIEEFDEGKNRILIATDVMARGLDLENISHVINFDTPDFPENYMHRIGRTGRAEKEGKSILFFTEKEKEWKEAIESLMNISIPQLRLPKEVEISKELIAEERPKVVELYSTHHKSTPGDQDVTFHEKSAKNKKVNLGGPKKRKAPKYKKPKTRGDKGFRKGKKNRRR